MHDTATECVECRCTTAPHDERSSYIAMCRKVSLEGLSPATSLPLPSSFEIRAGSRRPMHEFVGVISHPSDSFTLMLPALPCASPRSYSDLPSNAMCSRNWFSFIG